jgi:hypothetical protein
MQQCAYLMRPIQEVCFPCPIVIEELVRKHPIPQPAEESILIRAEVPYVDPAVFASI